MTWAAEHDEDLKNLRVLRSNFMWNGRAFSGVPCASRSLARRSQRRYASQGRNRASSTVR